MGKTHWKYPPDILEDCHHAWRAGGGFANRSDAQQYEHHSSVPKLWQQTNFGQLMNAQSGEVTRPRIP